MSALHPISFELFVKSLLSCLWILRQRWLAATFLAEFTALSGSPAQHLLPALFSSLLSIALLSLSVAALLRQHEYLLSSFLAVAVSLPCAFDLNLLLSWLVRLLDVLRLVASLHLEVVASLSPVPVAAAAATALPTNHNRS